MRRLLAAITLAGLAFTPILLTGCAEALFSRVSKRSHAAYSDEDFAAFRAIRRVGITDKGEVLATLGPPIQVLPQDRGDIFVYRRRARETNVVNLNPSMVSGFGPTVPVPIYFRSATTGREDTLMVFFDTDGRLRGDSVIRNIDDAGVTAGGTE